MTDEDREAARDICERERFPRSAWVAVAAGRVDGRTAERARIETLIEDGIAVEPRGEGAKALRELLEALPRD